MDYGGSKQTDDGSHHIQMAVLLRKNNKLGRRNFQISIQIYVQPINIHQQYECRTHYAQPASMKMTRKQCW